MAVIPGNISKMLDDEVNTNKPHSEQLMTKISENINALIDSDLEIYDLITTGNWLSPENASTAILIGCGGGSGGNRGGVAFGGHGGGGSPFTMNIVSIVQNTNYFVTIGAGGSGNVPGNPGIGNPGAATTFAGLATFPGALSAPAAIVVEFLAMIKPIGCTTGGNPSQLATFYPTYPSYDNGDGQPQRSYIGGSQGSIAAGGTDPEAGGGGGAGPYGNGANGGPAVNSGSGIHTAPSASANTGAGGGGGGSGRPGSTIQGGTGGSGRLIILVNG